MNIGKKFAAAAAVIFMTGLAAGAVCGIGMGGIFAEKAAPARETAGKDTAVWNMRNIRNTVMYPSHPVALWDSKAGKLKPSAAADRLYGQHPGTGKPFTPGDIKTPYALFVFESPVCPFCFIMHEYLLEIRKAVPEDRMEIITVSPPALSEESAAKAVLEVKKYMEASGSEMKKAYTAASRDRRGFRCLSMGPSDHAAVIGSLGIKEIPSMVLADRDLNILYRSEGYPSGSDAESRSFFMVWNALFSDISAGEGEMRP